MKQVTVIIAICVFIFSCQTAPVATESAVLLGNYKPGNQLTLKKLDYAVKAATPGQIEMIQAIAAQAAALNGFNLRVLGQAGAESEDSERRAVSISLLERDYSLDIEQWNSVVASLSLDNPPIRVLVTDDTHLSLKSAGYAYDRLCQLFKRLRIELDRVGVSP